MFKHSQKREVLEISKETLENLKNQNKLTKKINKKQLEKEDKKNLKKELSFREGELKKKIRITKKTKSKSFKDWFFNNSEL